MREKKDYLKDFILIPKEILQKNITPRACLLFGIIYKLSATICYATNNYFKRELNLKSERTINNLLNELKEHDCIKIEYDETNPNIRYLTPLITNRVKLIQNEINDLNIPNEVKEFFERIK